ncbi:MAG: hypothetical protein JXB08_01840 [Bacilli bacterium]|nr:hypothetical protein [Bacilli bacterium]MBN2877672.1 hypothetical protein [Bacilli bacterium]
MRKKVFLSMLILVVTISLFVISSLAYFTDLFLGNFNGEMGFVDVDVIAYFDDGVNDPYLAQEVVTGTFNKSTGISLTFTNSTGTIYSASMDTSGFTVGDTVRVTGTANNNGRYTIDSIPNSTSIVVSETLTDETVTANIEGIYTKTGVYYVDIVSDGNTYYFGDFRMYINVYSNVDTYIRVIIYEQLTLTYTDYQGQVTELSILFDGYMPFDYNFDPNPLDTENEYWDDNRESDYYIYYKTAVQRQDEFTPTEIPLISTFDPENFSTYTAGYSLQIAFSVEAVQSVGGPENVWNLTNPPWGGDW